MIRPAFILGNMGRILLIIGCAMLVCLAWSLGDPRQVVVGIAVSALLTITLGFLLMHFFSVTEGMTFKEGFALVSLGWFVASLFGSLPYMLSGYLPSFADAFFETVSGFTTTGASVVADVESWPRGLLFWRSLTQWLGGMGIIALFVAIIASMGVRANQLFKAEVPGPISDKVSPRVRETARQLWITYVILSIICALLLYLFGMKPFDAVCHTFAAMATGGFSTKNTSIAFYSSPAIQWTLIIFMFLAGANFSLHFLAYKKRSLVLYLKDQEFKFYLGIILTATALVVVSLSSAGIDMGWEAKIRTACFQVVSIMTTTGFATADYNVWPPLAAGVIFLMLFVGGCAGSTGGSIKPADSPAMAGVTAIDTSKAATSVFTVFFLCALYMGMVQFYHWPMYNPWDHLLPLLPQEHGSTYR